MKKPSPRRDKYFLRDVHKEIDLYDRKLAYLDKYGDFATPADREEAQGKMVTKRATLERTAKELAASGVEFEDKDLPRSFRVESPVQDSVRPGLFLVEQS
jgi:hypothetical protein